MSVELGALIRRAIPLTEVLAHAESQISSLSGTPVMAPLTVSGASMRAEHVVIGPFALPVREQGLRTRRPSYTSWELHDLHVSSQPVASIGLSVGHLLSDEEVGMSSAGLSEVQRLERAERAGYQAWITVHRSRPSLCLGALLACSIATLNRTRIIDDEGLLAQSSDLVDPAVVRAMFEKHGNCRNFAELSERFCADVGYRGAP